MRTMSLEALPPEIISRICGFLGTEVVDPFDPLWSRGLAVVVNRLGDFKSLRITCKELYQKTEYDATIRYAEVLESSAVRLDQSSLLNFLAFSRVPAFRDRIQEINLHNSFDPEDDEDDLDNEECEGDSRSSNRVRVCQRLALLKKFQASNEATELMLQFFRVLNTAKNLRTVELPHDFGIDLILRSMLPPNFNRKVVHFVVEPNLLATVRHGSYASVPQIFAPCVRGLRFQPYLFLRQDCVRGSKLHHDSDGLHIKGFRPTTFELNKLISALDGIEYLELNGCRSSPELRFCHGCDDAFVRNFAPMRYRYLTNLKITRFLISGGRLRALIKRHAQSLTSVYIGYVTLTDGSWRSVAQGLAKLPRITTLFLGHLQQKRRSDNNERPRQYHSTTTVFLRDFDGIRLFLEIFVTYFRTVERFNGARITTSLPKYYEASLFEIPQTTARSTHLQPGTDLLKNAYNL